MTGMEHSMQAIADGDGIDLAKHDADRKVRKHVCSAPATRRPAPEEVPS
jgi:hypothetical protein